MAELVYLDPRTVGVKEKTTWYSPHLQQETTLVRYGFYGVPLLLFPTAGGDCEEPERFFLIKQLEPFIHEGRLKVYTVDSIAGRTWLTDERVAHCIWIQKQFDNYIRREVVPAICNDCQTESIEMFTAGASIGALNALLMICRHPDVFSRALCLSGTFHIDKWLQGEWYEEFRDVAPLHLIPRLADSDQLSQLQQRCVILATGSGTNEDPDECWKVARALGALKIPNRVDVWDPSWPHDWTTWRAMIPQYMQELLADVEGS